MSESGNKFTSSWLRNFDWIYYLTGAYHKTWNIYENQVLAYELQMRRAAYYTQVDSGIIYLTNDSLVKGDLLVRGPSVADTLEWKNGYTQDTRYRCSGPFWSHDNVSYTARLGIKLFIPPSPETLSDTLCRFLVRLHYVKPDSTWGDSTFSKYVTVSEAFNHDPVTINYSPDFLQDNTAKISPINIDKICLTEFMVINYTQNHRYGINEIEVYDNWIWKKYFADGNNRKADSVITEYLSAIKNESGNNFFSDKAKFVLSIDEPHTVDSHDALRIVKNILADLRIDGIKAPKLLTSFYPEWDGYRNGEFLLKRVIREYNPDPLAFYYHYAPSDSMNKSNLDLLRILIESKITPGMDYNKHLFIMNVWNQTGSGFISPTKTALRSAVFMNLAFGAAGIIYAPLYSYDGVGGLIEMNMEPNALGVFTRDSVNSRLNGVLGKAFASFEYENQDISSFNSVGLPQDNTDHLSNSNFLSIDLSEINNKRFLLTKFIKENINTGNNDAAFFLLNYESEDTNFQSIKLNADGNKIPQFNNVRIFDIENGFFNKNISNTGGLADTSFIVNLRGGDGIMITYHNARMYGGELVVNDTVYAKDTLFGNLTINPGVSLKITGEYIIKDTLTLMNNASITGLGYIYPDSGIIINTSEWKKSVFRSRENGKAKLLWAKYPGTGFVNSYKVYKQTGSGGYNLLASLSNSTYSYTDTTVDVSANPDTSVSSNILLAKYFVEANIDMGGRSTRRDSTDEIGFYVRALEGEAGLEKKFIKSQIFEYRLSQNFPNPFNPATTISYEIADEGNVEIKLYDILGREIRTLINERQSPGSYKLSVNFENLPSGVYIYRMRAGKYTESKKMILLR